MYRETTYTCYVKNTKEGEVEVTKDCCGHLWEPELWKNYQVRFHSFLNKEEIEEWLAFVEKLFEITFTLEELTNSFDFGQRYEIKAKLVKKHLMIHTLVRHIWAHSDLVKAVLKDWKGDEEGMLLVLWYHSMRVCNGMKSVYPHKTACCPPITTAEFKKKFKALPEKVEEEEKINNFFAPQSKTEGSLIAIQAEANRIVDKYEKQYKEYIKLRKKNAS